MDAILTNNSKCIALTSDFTFATINPNPAFGEIVVNYTLPEDRDVKVNLYDSRGRLIKQLLSATESKGFVTHTFSVNELSRGVYYVKIVLKNDEKRMRFLKM